MFRLLIVAVLFLGLVSSYSGARDCSGNRLRKLNQDLDSWADKQEKELEKLIRNMDRNLREIQDRGPVPSLLGDFARIISVGVMIPFIAADFIFRDLLGLNKFWSQLFTIIILF